MPSADSAYFPLNQREITVPTGAFRWAGGGAAVGLLLQASPGFTPAAWEHGEAMVWRGGQAAGLSLLLLGGWLEMAERLLGPPRLPGAQGRLQAPMPEFPGGRAPGWLRAVQEFAR